MSYLRRVCGGRRMDDESNESVYNKYDLSSRGEGMKCGVIERVKHSILRWYGHMERMRESEMTKRVCVNKVEAVGIKGQLPVT